MGEMFYRELNEFRAMYPTREEQEQALRTMNAEKIWHLARACKNVQTACRYAQFAQEASDRDC